MMNRPELINAQVVATKWDIWKLLQRLNEMDHMNILKVMNEKGGYAGKPDKLINESNVWL